MGNLEGSLQSFDKATQIENKSGMLWYDRGVVALHLKNQQEARRSIDRAMALATDHFETLIARFVFEKQSNTLINDDLYLTPARNLDPEKFTTWKKDYDETGNPLASLRLEEMAEDPFSLPLTRPLSVIEPVTLFHYLMEKPIL